MGSSGRASPPSEKRSASGLGYMYARNGRKDALLVSRIFFFFFGRTERKSVDFEGVRGLVLCYVSFDEGL